MGDRVSIQFVDGDDKSIALFNHWGGFGFVKTAQKYLKTIPKDSNNLSTPLGRREPEVVMVDFVRWYFAEVRKGKPSDSLYFGATGNDGDNSDNGNWLIDVHTGDIDHG